MYTCAQCAIHACSKENPEQMPKNCPIRNQDLMERVFPAYQEEENREFYIKSSELEALGYGVWPRVREVMEFSRAMGYHRLGLAFCKGLRNEAKVLDTILRRNGFEVVSVICKAGGISKERAGIPEEHKVHPGQFEAMCNPISQAALLAEQQTQFNLVLGLCVGHDSLFYKYSQAPATTVVTKDRVLAHNPAGALYCAEGYFRNKL